jgi:hypothetical protein
MALNVKYLYIMIYFVILCLCTFIYCGIYMWKLMFIVDLSLRL